MRRLEKATYLSFLLKSILSVRFGNNLCGSDNFTMFRIHKYNIYF